LIKSDGEIVNTCSIWLYLQETKCEYISPFRRCVTALLTNDKFFRMSDFRRFLAAHAARNLLRICF